MNPTLHAEDPITLPDLEETLLNPMDPGEKKAVVLFFISPYCPTSNTLKSGACSFASGF